MYKLFIQTECPGCKEEMMMSIMGVTNDIIHAQCECDCEFTIHTPTNQTHIMNEDGEWVDIENKTTASTNCDDRTCNECTTPCVNDASFMRHIQTIINWRECCFQEDSVFGGTDSKDAWYDLYNDPDNYDFGEFIKTMIGIIDWGIDEELTYDFSSSFESNWNAASHEDKYCYIEVFCLEYAYGSFGDYVDEVMAGEEERDVT